MKPRVWAPEATSPQIEVQGRRLGLAAAGGGWWESPLDLAPGTAYAFRVDGDDALPDPRTRRQPWGVHGASAVEEDRFTWHDAGWRTPELHRMVCYELHLGTFSDSGDCEGAIPHLDALAELGVTAISVMPVATFAGERGWGYDGVDLYAPYLPYGGSEGLRRLVDAAHQRGLAVILDCVYNHLGPEGNYLPRFGPYFSTRHQTPWGAALNFDGPGSQGVRDFCIDNAVSWLRDWHLDGLRLDAVHAIFDDSPTHVLAEMRRRVDREVSPDRWLIAECDRLDPRLVAWGMTAQWSDDVHHALHALLTGERGGYYADFGSTAQLVQALRAGFVREPRAPLTGPPDGRRLVAFT
ncbi:MAG: malto-oligosyltrehalose trehalohydrolase, partial [Candidatus Dormibacteraeota bacterium]|nr:malto-oligosyltrehalose trehalohydrolase [Candidatus Dormibacteraeota bacterium]